MPILSVILLYKIVIFKKFFFFFFSQKIYIEKFQINMTYNFESDLSEAFGQLLKIETDYNVIIHIGKEPNFKEFHLNFFILRCRYDYFNKTLSTENIKKKNGNYIIKLKKISPKIFYFIFN